jgi:hypothetical protein
MRGLTRNQTTRSILPYVTTILSISLAATLRVEHACSEAPSPARIETQHLLVTPMFSSARSGFWTSDRIFLRP